jgi:hypothetical protein
MEKQFEPLFSYRYSIGGPIRGQSRGVCWTLPLDANHASLEENGIARIVIAITSRQPALV